MLDQNEFAFFVLLNGKKLKTGLLQKNLPRVYRPENAHQNQKRKDERETRAAWLELIFISSILPAFIFGFGKNLR